MKNEATLKKELLQRLIEKNYISKKKQELYGQSLLREYRKFAEIYGPVKEVQLNKKKDQIWPSLS